VISMKSGRRSTRIDGKDCNGRSGLFPSNHVEKTTSLGFLALSTKAPPTLTGEKFSSYIPTPDYQP